MMGLTGATSKVSGAMAAAVKAPSPILHALRPLDCACTTPWQSAHQATAALE